MDPFLSIVYKDEEFRTKVIKEGGQRPVWNDNFELEVTSHDELMKITCFDEDFFDNDVVGDATMSVGMFCSE
jgi:Ca2+-dependent lipid-binding protein